MLDILLRPGMAWFGLILIGLSAGLPVAQAQAQAEQRPPPLFLISIDGFRHDYFRAAETPALDRLIRGGFKAESLYQVFPTKTFPTHYSAVTGRHPGTHGVVANSMWDRRDHRRFTMRDRDAVGDGYWYRDGEPIWVTAERQGMSAVTYFWPGSEARIHGIRPSEWKLYSAAVPHAERIEQILEWMDQDDEQRPGLYTLYFSRVDSLGHRHGPLADEVIGAVTNIDHHIGVLLDGIEQRVGLDNAHIIVISDHGMSHIDLERYIMLDDYIDLSSVRVTDWGPAAQIWATDMSVDEIMARLEDAHEHMRVWRREDIPERYRFGTHRRVPDVLAEADLGWMINNRPYMAAQSRFPLRGMHGWDPAWLEMHGILLAHGPAFSAGSRSPAMRSVDLYALMTRLLELRPAVHEGSVSAFLPYLESEQALGFERQHFQCESAGMEIVADIGPNHLGLHIDEQTFVLDRLVTLGGRFYFEVDVYALLHGERAVFGADGRLWPDCLRTAVESIAPGR
jgi:predicted AlkP superfamily pyrophosphatase or phosphodiesterase